MAELEIGAPSEEGVFAEALAAFAELAGKGSGASVSRAVEVEADDGAMLLVEWLSELVYLCEVEQSVPRWISLLELGDEQAASHGRGAPRSAAAFQGGDAAPARGAAGRYGGLARTRRARCLSSDRSRKSCGRSRRRPGRTCAFRRGYSPITRALS
jgi:Archease protein family (MTH1598/TM1083)